MSNDRLAGVWRDHIYYCVSAVSSLKGAKGCPLKGSLQISELKSVFSWGAVSKQVNSKIAGVIGRDGGYTAKVADACIIIPTVNEENITPHSEAFQSVIWHLLVSHPKLKLNQTKWESI